MDDPYLPPDPSLGLYIPPEGSHRLYVAPKVPRRLRDEGKPPSIPMPGEVGVAAALVLILAVYATVMAFPLCIVGSFVGPPIFYAFLVHAVLAGSMYPCWKGLRRGKPWARWIVATVATLGLMAVPAAVWERSMSGSALEVEMRFPLATSFYALAILCTLFTPRANVYFATA